MAGDVLRPSTLIIPSARTSDGKLSGAYVLTSATTGAMVMSGAKLYIYDGNSWTSGATEIA